MDRHKEMEHVLVERNLRAYADAMWELRKNNYSDHYVMRLTKLRECLAKTVGYMDDLIKEVKDE